MTAIGLHGVTKVHRDRHGGEVRALDGLDLTLPEDSVTVLCGPGGSGKTTVLRVIAGLDQVDDGRVSFDGVDVTPLPTRERDVAFVTQDSAFYPNMTVREQLAEALRHHDVDHHEASERVMAEARALGLVRALDRPVAQLSAGDRQRLALGRALVRSPAVLLLDEPLAAVDAHERARIRAELVRLWRGWQATTVYVTQDMTEAMALADRLAFLDAGRLLQIDRPEVCYHRPATAVVASIINGPGARIIDAEVTSTGLRLGPVPVPLGVGQRRAIGARHRVLVAVRAGSARHAPDGPSLEPTPAPDAGVPAAVTVEQVLGVGPVLDLEVVLEPAGPTAPRLIMQVPPATNLRPGDSAMVRLDIGACSIFDAADGHALHHGREHGPA